MGKLYSTVSPILYNDLFPNYGLVNFHILNLFVN